MDLQKIKLAMLDAKFSAVLNSKASISKDACPSKIMSQDPCDKKETQKVTKKKTKRRSKTKKNKKESGIEKLQNKKSEVGESQSLLGEFSCALFYQPLNYFCIQQVVYRHPAYEPLYNPRSVSLVDMICVPFQGSRVSHEDITLHFGRYNENLWFHGTSLFQSAESILNEGIKLGVAKRRNDFSVGEGFYVSDDFDAACDRANRNQDCGYAVLVFRLQEKNVSSCFLDLNSNTTLWRKMVRFNRSGCTKEIDLRAGISQGFMGRKNSTTLRNVHLNEIDFIKGPICYDITKILDDNFTDRPVLMKNSSGRVIQQLCIRSQRFAQVFGSLANICAVVWVLPRPQ